MNSTKFRIRGKSFNATTTVTFLLVITSFTALSQRQFNVSLDNAAVTLANRSFYIDSIVDARAVKENIGMAQVGLNNKQVEAQFVAPFQETMTKYFKRSLPPFQGAHRIIAVVNDLRISEKTYKMKERGMADVEITFCRLDSGRLFALKTISDHQENGGMDVTAGHEARLASALSKCLAEFNELDIRTLAGNLYNVAMDWRATDPEQDIFRCSSRIPGSYGDFKAMRSNSPLAQSISLEPRGYLYMARNSETKKKLKDSFGVCDGTYLYINTLFYNANGATGIYARVVEEGRIMLWYDHYMSATEAGVVGGAFGLVGTAIAASDLDLIGLDMKTGVVRPIKIKYLEQLLQEDPELLEQYLNSKDKGDVALMASFVKRFNSRQKL